MPTRLERLSARRTDDLVIGAKLENETKSTQKPKGTKA